MAGGIAAGYDSDRLELDPYLIEKDIEEEAEFETIQQVRFFSAQFSWSQSHGGIHA